MPHSSATLPPHSVVILAAGRGERFAGASPTPKPLLTFQGETLLQHTLRKAREFFPQRTQLIVVGTIEVLAAIPEERGVRVVHTQPGPAASGLLAASLVPQNEAVIFMDCDNFYRANASFGRPFVEEDFKESFIVISEVPPFTRATDFCHVAAEEKDANKVSYVMEKVVLEKSIGVGVGIYGFSSMKRFQRAAWWYLASSHKEPSISQVLWVAAARGLRYVRVDGWHPVGTPSQMQLATKWLA